MKKGSTLMLELRGAFEKVRLGSVRCGTAGEAGRADLAVMPTVSPAEGPRAAAGLLLLRRSG